MDSCVVTGHLVVALYGTAEFCSGGNALLMGEGRYKIRWRNADDVKTELGEDHAVASTEDARWTGRITRTGAWLSVLPSTDSGTELGVQE